MAEFLPLTALQLEQLEEFKKNPELVEIFSSPNYIGGSYDYCHFCEYYRKSKTCDGPNLGMTSTARVHEYWRVEKAILGYSNAKIAQDADVSERTVARHFSPNPPKDIPHSVFFAINKALLGRTSGQYPCPLAQQTSAETRNEMVEEAHAKAELSEVLQKNLDSVREYYENEIANVRQSFHMELKRAREVASVRIAETEKVYTAMAEDYNERLADSRRKIDFLLAENEKKNKFIEKLLEK